MTDSILILAVKPNHHHQTITFTIKANQHFPSEASSSPPIFVNSKAVSLTTFKQWDFTGSKQSCGRWVFQTFIVIYWNVETWNVETLNVKMLKHKFMKCQRQLTEHQPSAKRGFCYRHVCSIYCVRVKSWERQYLPFSSSANLWSFSGVP